MRDVQKRRCAECGSLDYKNCVKKCWIYWALNEPCTFCGRIPTMPLAISTDKGRVVVYVCESCLAKLS